MIDPADAYYFSRDFPEPDHVECPECFHSLDEHSSEPDVGCLYVLGPVRICACMEPGCSEADQ